MESALADPDEFRASSRAYRTAGHRIEVVALATAEALSQLGIVDRFLTDTADGGGRYVSWENHDTCAKGLLATLAVIETSSSPTASPSYGATAPFSTPTSSPPRALGGAARLPSGWFGRSGRGRGLHPSLPSSAAASPVPTGACTPNWLTRTCAWPCSATASARPPGPSRSAVPPSPPRRRPGWRITGCRRMSTSGSSTN
ncbi:zeta toxin family protein [Streptomyces mirabilis]